MDELVHILPTVTVYYLWRNVAKILKCPQSFWVSMMDDKLEEIWVQKLRMNAIQMDRQERILVGRRHYK